MLRAGGPITAENPLIRPGTPGHAIRAWPQPRNPRKLTLCWTDRLNGENLNWRWTWWLKRLAGRHMICR
jgi:hypothetical protein